MFFFIDINSNIDSLESAIDRFVNIDLKILVASGTLCDTDLNKCFELATELKGLLALPLKKLNSPKITEVKNKHLTSLKNILSKFDWKCTDIFEGKTQVEIENMELVFLTTYQLLTELDKVEIIENIEIEEGKIYVDVNNMVSLLNRN